MPQDDESVDASENSYDDYVPAMFARSEEEAEACREFLTDHDIPAVVGDDERLGNDDDAEIRARRLGMTHGMPVLVPESLLDEASEILAEHGESEKFEAVAESDEFEDEEDSDQEDEDLGLGEVLEPDEEEALDDDLFEDDDETEEDLDKEDDD